MSLDYKDFIENKYPEPDKRMTAKDFPALDELFVYGEDFPIPESMEELRCRYNEDDRFPLVLADLEGYKAPPLGLTSVAACGSGHKRGFLYPPGTFREDKVRFGKEFGITPEGAVVIREEANVRGMVEGIRKSFDKRGVEIDGRSKAAVYEAVAEVMMDKIFDDKTSRESLKLLNKLESMFFGIENPKGERTNKTVMSLEEAREWLLITERAKKLFDQKGETIDVTVVEVDE